MRTIVHYINGTWTESESNEINTILNPATHERVSQVKLGNASDLDDAVRSAQSAFVGWRKTPVIQRVQPLFRLKALMDAHLDELSKIMTTEHGKTLSESRAELGRAIQMLETACGMPALMMGDKAANISSGIDCYAVRDPMGVFACISPFNFPSMIGFWFWPFAVAAGNTYIWKPSEKVPNTPARIFELVHEAGFPPGVINLVQGDRQVAEAICRHPGIKGISFVGSTPVAKAVYDMATSTGKRVQALGGAKNFMVVMPDAPFENAAKVTSSSVLGCAGERCLAASVIISVGDAHAPLREEILKETESIKVGNGLEPQTDMGPLISEEAVKRVSELIESAQKEGAKIVVDGRIDPPKQGNFLNPTIIEGITPDMRIAREEVFGPVILLASVEQLDDAVEWINNSPYGNTTSIITRDGGAARKFCEDAIPSMIGVNIGVPAPMAFFSFGGTRDSFFGDIKAHGKDCIPFFTDTKTVIERWNYESSIW